MFLIYFLFCFQVCTKCGASSKHHLWLFFVSTASESESQTSKIPAKQCKLSFLLSFPLEVEDWLSCFLQHGSLKNPTMCLRVLPLVNDTGGRRLECCIPWTQLPFPCSSECWEWFLVVNCYSAVWICSLLSIPSFSSSGKQWLVTTARRQNHFCSSFMPLLCPYIDLLGAISGGVFCQ